MLRRLLTRRRFLQLSGGFTAGLLGVGTYSVKAEVMRDGLVRRYQLRPDRWPEGLRLSIAVITDIHACEPWMPVRRIETIVETVLSLQPDLIAILGDFPTSHRFVTRRLGPEHWAPPLRALKAPFGVHAVLGNHDWWSDAEVQRLRKGPPLARRAIEGVGIPVYENDALRLEKDGRPFWIAGLGDQIAFRGHQHGEFFGVDDLPGTLAKVTGDAPVILLAHEPDIFTHVPPQVAVTLCGHTHGGQVRVFGYSPWVPSSYGNRFAYGHVEEEGRHLVVSGGLGCSTLPVRLGVPPEVVVVELG